MPSRNEEISDLQAARIDAANNHYDACARYREVNGPLSAASDEEIRRADEECAATLLALNEAKFALSAALTEERLEREREEREADDNAD